MKSKQSAHQLVSKIITLQSNPHYRMADIFYRRGVRYIDSTENVLLRPEFDQTIMKRYLSEIPDVEQPSLELLLSIEQEFKLKRNMKLPSRDEVVVHVRAGDVIQHDWFLKTDYCNLIRRCRGGSKKCTIVICFAFQEFAERGWWLFTEEKLERNIIQTTDLLRKLISNFPDMEFDVFSNANIDQDFVYMVEAPIFIRDQGESGLSELVTDLRALRIRNSSGPDM